ncbi:hypothetical protein KBY65_05935 [Cyanobium sp. Alchichica 3B3-8F6]|uniref:hypothetical protein n=1 Tax=Synechococcales TaxID=1890424 RepID=UPI000B99881C|nr:MULTISPECIES: hypothetical protein [Synechococcales]MCP9882017.1 hypothetical protein [Cyanobium sp. Alchichica 3B3-8F6]
MSPEQQPSEIDSTQASPQDEDFQAHPEHAAAVNAALDAIQHLIDEQPEFADFLRLTTSTEDVRQALHNHGIEITNEALWRHRGSLLKDGQPTWRG